MLLLMKIFCSEMINHLAHVKLFVFRNLSEVQSRDCGFQSCRPIHQDSQLSVEYNICLTVKQLY